MIESEKELKEREQQQSQRLLAVTEMSRARHDEEKESAQLLMMETMAKMQRQQNEWDSLLEANNQKLAASKERSAVLLKQLADSESERKSLSKQLKTQQRLYAELKAEHKRSENEMATKRELMDRVEQQKAFIVRLQAEKEDLVANKEIDDKQLFMELEYLRNKSIVTKVWWVACHGDGAMLHVAWCWLEN